MGASRTTLGIACALLSNAVHAQTVAAAASPPTPAATAWACALSDDLVRLHCAAADGASPQPATTAVNGTAFPLDPRRHWVVDLWSPPTEIAFVEHLARATICYRSPGCTVTLEAPSLATARVASSRSR